MYRKHSVTYDHEPSPELFAGGPSDSVLNVIILSTWRALLLHVGQMLRSFSRWFQFASLPKAQLTSCRSLRDGGDTLGAQAGKL